MKYTPLQAAAWLAFYLFLSLLPLGLVFVGEIPEPRGFWVEFGVGLGFVGLSMMGLQFLLTGRFRGLAEGFGLDNMLQFHRQSGLVATALVLAHPIVLFIADPDYLSFLDPGVYPARAAVLGSVILALVVLIGSTLWRESFGIPYEWWRAGHGLLALLIVMLGLGHVLLVGHYVDPWWKKAIWFGVTTGAMAMLIHGRVIRPWLLSKKPWKVVDLREERGSSWSLRLEPDGHEGFDFEAGQFAWLTLGNSPYGLQQHPFTLSSSAEASEAVEFTIKELGDFTATIKDVPMGTPAYVEGPFGAFTLDDETAQEGAVFVVGGVGITPVMSMLRTLRDRGDCPELQIFYANKSPSAAIFYDELEEMARDLPLELHHVFEEPPEDWEGPTGMLNEALLDELMWEDNGRRRYYVCGPEPMMDVAEHYLIDRGIDGLRVFSERFKIV